ncbi:MAG TPA: hypothetical protein ENG62_00425 [Thermoplasmatales archaeon]|nr:hypothetical protein [Thermoplasmatales archaeon]
MIHREENAVVGIVSAILLVGLLVTVFTIIQTVYVPQWMEEREAEHMKNIGSQFMFLKFAIDTELVSNSSLSITVPITLGTDKIPFLLSEKSYGSLELKKDACRVEIREGGHIYSFNLGVIEYSSRNNYFVDQKYIYENGAIIISQTQGNTLVSPGFFSISKENNRLTIDMTIVNISTSDIKTTAYGYSTASVLVKRDPSGDMEIEIENISQIRIYTSYSHAWKKFFEKTFIEAGLEENKDYWFTENKDSITINLGYSNLLHLSSKGVYAEVAPSWLS